MRVGLIGSPERQEVQRLMLRLEERGADGVVLDPRGDPRIELGASSESIRGIELARFNAFYVADLALPAVREADDGSELRASQRRLVLWNTLLERLARRCRVVNPPGTWDLHGQKPFESSVYRRMDFPAPWTLATSTPGALMDLPAHVAAWITKGLVGGYGYTETFTPPRDEAEARAALAQGPRMVQERVAGENIRVFVIGDEALGAAEIVPTSPDEVDSRRGAARMRRVTLPADARKTALLATKRFGLPFSAVDFIRDAHTGRWWILECNSAPFFVEFERHTGIDVSSALADLLTERARRVAVAAT